MPVPHLLLAYHFKQLLPFFFEDVTSPPGVSIFVGKSTSWQSVLTPVYFLSNKETLREAAAAAAKGEIPTTAGER